MGNKKKLRNTIFIFTAIFLIFAVVYPAFAGTEELEKQEYGIISLLPPIIAIGLCIITKEVIPSLLIGSWVAGTILSGWNPISGFGKSIAYLYNSLGDPWGARIALTSLAMGGLVGIMRVGGAFDAVVHWITKRIKSARGALLATELAGLVIFFEDYVNTVVVGTAMGPITQEYKISKEKLSYVVDSTAAPIACIAGISTWVAYMVGQIQAQFTALDIGFSSYMAYLNSIPYILYNIITLVLVTYIVLSQRDFGPMLKAERRARTTGKLLRDGAQPLITAKDDKLACDEKCPRRVINFIVPILTLVGLIFFLMLKTGGWPEASFAEALGNSNSSVSLVLGAYGAATITIIFFKIQGLAPLNKLLRGFMEGMHSIFYGTLILVFAWGIGAAIKEIGTAKYIVSITENILSPGMIPLISFIIGAIIAFSTGTSYGTMAILTPIVVPLVYNTSQNSGIDPMTYMFATLGAIFAGAVFGDHCSPISDTTIMSSMFSGADHMDHVNTQIPYALLCAGGTIVAYIGVAFRLPALVNIVLGAAATVLAFRLISKPIEPEKIPTDKQIQA